MIIKIKKKNYKSIIDIIIFMIQDKASLVYYGKKMRIKKFLTREKVPNIYKCIFCGKTSSFIDMYSHLCDEMLYYFRMRDK